MVDVSMDLLAFTPKNKYTILYIELIVNMAYKMIQKFDARQNLKEDEYVEVI